MTYEEMREAVRRELERRFDAELAKKGFSFKEAFDHGIAADWAEWLEGWGVPVSAWRRVIHTPHAKRTSTKLHSDVNINSNTMDQSHRIAISEGRPGRTSEFLKAIRKRDYTLNTLAKDLGISPALLSMHRTPKAKGHSRPISAARAAEVKRLTGWPDDASHWPAGITS